LACDGGEGSASLSSHFTPREKAPGTHWTEGWMDPRTGLDTWQREKSLLLPAIEPQLSSQQPRM